MAKYESIGYCPANILDRNTNARTLLGDRVGYLVYPEEPAKGECYLFHIFQHDPELARILSDVLIELIPECVYNETGKKIEVFDINGGASFTEGAYIMRGKNFMIVVEDGKESVKVKIHKDAKFVRPEIKLFSDIIDPTEE